jgi:hypothetical protein
LEAEQEELEEQVLEVKVQLLLRLEYLQQEEAVALHKVRLDREDLAEVEAGEAQDQAVMETHQL